MVAQYFAQLNAENIVIDVHCVTAEFMAENPERYTGVWVETFFDAPNKQYAGIGFIYDEDTENFVAPIPPPNPNPLPIE
jgi:hypothetical protein